MISTNRFLVIGNRVVPGRGFSPQASMEIADFDPRQSLNDQLKGFAQARGFDLTYGVAALPMAAGVGGPADDGPRPWTFPHAG